MNTQKIENRLDELTNQIYWLEKKSKIFPKVKSIASEMGTTLNGLFVTGRITKKISTQKAAPIS